MSRSSGALLPSPVVMLSLARLTEAAGNGFIVIAIPASVALLPHDVFDMSESLRVGLTVSLFGLVMALVQPVIGRLSSAWGRDRGFLFVGLAAFSGCTAAMGAATAFWHLLALRTMQGVFMAMVIPPTLALIVHHAAASQRGAAMGFYGTARMLGFGLGPVCGGWLLLELPLPASYLVAAVPGVLAILMVLAGVPRGLSPVEVATGSAPRPASTQAQDPGMIPILALAGGLFAAACSVSIIIVLENEFLRRLGMSTFEFGLAFSAMILIRIFVDWPIGRLSDRIGRKRLIVPGLCFLGPLTVLMAYMPTMETLTGVRLVMGVAMALISAPTFALASDLAPPEAVAARMSWVTAGFSLGLAVGPLMTGALASAFGFYAPFWVAGALCLAAAVLVWTAIVPASRPSLTRPEHSS